MPLYLTFSPKMRKTFFKILRENLFFRSRRAEEVTRTSSGERANNMGEQAGRGEGGDGGGGGGLELSPVVASISAVPHSA